MRIASLVPSATEIVYSLGLGDHLVGRSPECDYPPEVVAKPVVSASVFDGAALASPDIDATVRRHLAGPDGAASLYHVDGERLRRARPDLLLTQGLCRVCAASVEAVRRAADSMDRPPEVLSLDPTSLDDIFEDILLVGEKTGQPERAKGLVAALRERVEVVRRTVSGRARPGVVCIEWFDPVFSAGHWVPEQVAYAGGEERIGRPRTVSHVVPWDRIVAAEPEVLVLMACGFDVPRAIQEVHRITRREGFASIPAVRDGRVFVVNGSAYFNRPGPRTVDGVELLAHLFHPDVFPEPWPDSAVRRLT